MSNAAIMAPVFALIALTFATLLKVAGSRYMAVKLREVKLSDVALSSQGWSIKVKKVSNNYNNQLQLPILFYIAIGFFILLAKVDAVAVVLAWAFVASRYVHTFIHIGSNNVGNRFFAFLFGSFMLATLWVWLALRFYVIG